MANTGASLNSVEEVRLFLPTEMVLWARGLEGGEEKYVEEMIDLVEEYTQSLAGEYFPNAERVTVSRSEHRDTDEAWYRTGGGMLRLHSSSDTEISATLHSLKQRAYRMAEEEIERQY